MMRMAIPGGTGATPTSADSVPSMLILAPVSSRMLPASSPRADVGRGQQVECVATRAVVGPGADPARRQGQCIPVVAGEEGRASLGARAWAATPSDSSGRLRVECRRPLAAAQERHTHQRAARPGGRRTGQEAGDVRAMRPISMPQPIRMRWRDPCPRSDIGGGAPGGRPSGHDRFVAVCSAACHPGRGGDTRADRMEDDWWAGRRARTRRRLTAQPAVDQWRWRAWARRPRQRRRPRCRSCPGAAGSRRLAGVGCRRTRCRRGRRHRRRPVSGQPSGHLRGATSISRPERRGAAAGLPDSRPRGGAAGPRS